jgi:hypothetical protein
MNCIRNKVGGFQNDDQTQAQHELCHMQATILGFSVRRLALLERVPPRRI